MIGPGGLTGVPKYQAVAAGTVTIDPGGILQMIAVHASAGGATLTIFGGSPIPIPSGGQPTVLQYFHTLYAANSQNAGAIVGTGTDMLYVHWVRPGHGAA